MNRSLRSTIGIIPAFSLLLLLVSSGPLRPQGNETRLPALDQFLNPDGSLDPAESNTGSIDGRGWRIEPAPDGSPRFVRQGEIAEPVYAGSLSADDDNWDDRFGNGPGSNGIDDEVFALASDGIRLYVGGAFTKAGDIAANNIVSWDGKRWQILGTGPGILNGVNGTVNSIVIDGDIIYVGGQFTNAGGTPVQNVARYSISSRTWANVTGGISGTNAFVSTIMLDGDNVYVGGTFSRAGSLTVNNIAIWNRTTQAWSALGTGVQGNVNAIAKGPDGVYVGGSFSSAGGVASSSVARWDGTAWHSLAGGVNGSVNAIAVLGNRVFVGGQFNRAGDTAVNNIARWYVDSSLWSRLTGIEELVGQYFRVEGNGVDDVVRSIEIDGNNVYVSGTFRSAFPGDLTLDPVSTNYIARWFEPTEVEWWQTNTWWAPLGRGARNGMNGFVNALAFFDGELYAGGAFSRAGGQNADGIARWDGIRWLSLTTGVNNFIFTLALTDEQEVYVGGEFNQTGSSNTMGIAKLNGSQWELVNGAVNGSIYALAAAGDWIYVGGYFNQVGSVPARNVARWNRVTGQWSALGSSAGPGNDSTLSYVSAIAIRDDEVYLGGLFSSAGGIVANGIARWNSATDTWTSLESGINGSVFSIIFHNDDVYVGGRFLGAGGVTHAKNIALWSDGTWHALDTGTNNAIWTMGLRGSELFVGGEFTAAGSVDANHLAAWNIDTKTWSSPGGGVDDDFLPVVNTIALSNGRLYVGGVFTTAGEQPVSNVASWDGSSWNSMGSGVDNYVYQMAVSGNKVYVAGAFTQAGAKPSYYFGIYTDPALSVDDDVAFSGSTTLRQNSPNPFAGSTTIGFTTASSGRVALTVYDTDGNLVGRIVDNTLPTGEHRVTWTPEGIASGVYFCRLEADGTILTRTMVKAE